MSRNSENLYHSAAPNGIALIRCLVFGLVALTEPALSGAAQLRIADVNLASDRTRIRVVVEPKDDAGRPLRDLPADRFVVSVDGIAPPAIGIQRASADDQPLATVLALDISKSMVKGNALGNASDSSMALTKNMLAADQACLVVFGDSVRVLSDCTSDKTYVQRFIVGIFPGDDKTLLFDGLLKAVDLAAKATTGRAVVIALTDGKDEGSAATLEDVAKKFQETGISFYALGFGPRADAKTLQRLAALAGGEYRYALSADELPALYRSIRERLKNGYALDIALPSLSPGHHKVEVGLEFRGQTINSSKEFLVPRAPAPKWLWVIILAATVLALLLVSLSAAALRARKRIQAPTVPVLAPVWLEVSSGTQSGRRLHFTSDVFRVGPKSPANPSAGRFFVSGADLEVRKSPEGTFLITDVGSSNEIRINGANVRRNQSVRLRDKDRIAAAATEFIFRDTRPAAGSASNARHRQSGRPDIQREMSR